MMHKSEVIVVATQLILILTTIERLAAYSTNIAEAIVFIVEGRLVKHKRKLLEEPKNNIANPEPGSLVEPDPEEGE
jgi:phosphate uptake regulator